MSIVKKINYFLISLVLCFIILATFKQPVTYENHEPIDFVKEIPEIQLNIPLEEGLEKGSENIYNPEEFTPSDLTNFSPAWTIKVKTYSDKGKLLEDINYLKKLGYKVYSRFDKNSINTFNLYIGPTLLKKDSLLSLEELQDLGGFNPEVLKYD